MDDRGEAIRLWDWPVRLIHWSFVLLLPALWWTWKKDRMETHELLGYITLALLVFRILWGFFGSETARFAHFLKGPREIAAYVRGKSEPAMGHNPLGALSVILLLGLMIAQTVSGLFTQDVDGIESGPLTHFISYDLADAARAWHGLFFNLLLAMVALHLCAILFYLVIKRDNLVGPMITGRKKWKAVTPTAPAHAPFWRIAVAAVVAAGIAWWVSKGAPF